MRMWENGDLNLRIREKGVGCITSGGYIQTKKNGILKYEHVWVAEDILGKPLPPSACVHHANGKRSDNRPGNLVICPDLAYHNLLHRRINAKEATGNADYVLCAVCKEYDAPSNLVERKVNTRTRYHHRECINEYMRNQRRKTQ
jgi:hypothetical protein